VRQSGVVKKSFMKLSSEVGAEEDVHNHEKVRADLRFN